MKKLITLLLALTMVLCLVACGSSNDAKADDTAENTGIDMSKYPADINEWSGQNFNDYFTEAGIFHENNAETWLQDHEIYWPGTPVDECAGWWTDDGSAMVMICILKESHADSSAEDYSVWKSAIVETKALPGEYSAFAVDHLVGNVTFSYSSFIMDDDVYEAMDAAYLQLVEALGVTPDF